MASITQDDVLNALRTVKFPGFNRDIVSFGFVKNVEISGVNVLVHLAIRTNSPEHAQAIKDNTEQVLQAIPKVGRVSLKIDIESPGTQAGGQASQAAQGIPGVGHVIAVASGKGGVGKSTIAANLAAAFHASGLKVGLCDCDIHGPSMGLMFGARGGVAQEDDGQIIPPEFHGIKVMTMALLLEDTNAAVLRGPMINRYTTAFLRQTNWAPLDVLVLDLPPGTGDVQLTIGQSISLTGAVLVTTPQEVALVDVRRAASMFEKLNIPILGVVENMSYFLCPGDGKRYDIFGSGGGEREAKRLRIPLLGQIPIDMEARECADRGVPIVFANSKNATAVEFIKISQKLREGLQNARRS